MNTNPYAEMCHVHDDNHPLSKSRAREMWDGVPDSVYAHGFEEADRDIQDHTLAAMRAAHDAGKADVQTDDDGWEPLDWSKNPARIGDEVKQTCVIRRVTQVRRGVIDSFDSDGDPCANALGFGLIGERNHGAWRVRRKTSDPLADLTPGTVIRDVSIVGLKEHCDAFILAHARGPYVITAYGSYFLALLTAFTTDDRRTRWTREDGTWTAENLGG